MDKMVDNVFCSHLDIADSASWTILDSETSNILLDSETSNILLDSETWKILPALEGKEKEFLCLLL
jgi:hypothetical protein